MPRISLTPAWQALPDAAFGVQGKFAEVFVGDTPPTAAQSGVVIPDNEIMRLPITGLPAYARGLGSLAYLSYPTSVVPDNPLEQFYGVGDGQIAIHYATDAVTLSGGNVVALQNKGGAGAVFDATVDGTPIALDGNYLSMVAGGGRPQLANAADLMNVHLMMVVDMLWPTAGFYRFIGGAGTFISRNNTSGLISVGRAGFATRTFTVPVDLNFRLIEVIMSGTSIDLILDGVSYSGGSAPAWPEFPVTYIGRGSGGNIFDFRGRMGDVLGVTLGAGSAAAITAAREYLVAKFGLVPPPDPNPLAPFYGTGPGMIAIHYATDSVTPAGGPVASFQNKGGAGAMFDASVVGEPMVVSGDAVVSSQTTGIPSLLNPAEGLGVHLFMVLSPNQFTGSNQILGSQFSVIRQANGASGWRLNVWHNPGGGGVTFSSTIFNPNVEGFVLCEVKLTPTQVIFYINGVEGGSYSHPYLTFPIDRLASGSNGNDRFKGLVGDILGVTLGAGDEAAITEARRYLAAKYNLVVPSIYPLNHPEAVARGMTINSVGADHLTADISTTVRKTYTLPSPPAGSRVQFDITTPADCYLRRDDENSLFAPTETLWSTDQAGSYSVDVVVPNTPNYNLIGFLSPTSSATVLRITNWRVTLP